MARGRLDPPDLDDREWKDIVDQAKALIPKYAPEWTDHNPSDLGITLIELFAWMVESLIYRLNRVPAKNYIEFLNLLGITRDPATPASTYLTFEARSTEKATVPVDKGSQAATRQTETEDAVVFETDEDLDVQPTNLLEAWVMPAHEGSRDLTSQIIGDEVVGALISIPAKGTSVMLLGFEKASDESHVKVNFTLNDPAPQKEVSVTWIHFPPALNLKESSIQWPELKLDEDSDTTKKLTQSGEIKVKIASTWKQQKAKSWFRVIPDDASAQLSKPRYWMGARIENSGKKAVAISIKKVSGEKEFGPDVAVEIPDISLYENRTWDILDSHLSKMPLVIPQGQSCQICFRFDNPIGKLFIPFRFSKPAKAGDIKPKWLYSTPDQALSDWNEIKQDSDETNGFQNDGKITLNLKPADWGPMESLPWSGITPDPDTPWTGKPPHWLCICVENNLRAGDAVTPDLEVSFTKDRAPDDILLVKDSGQYTKATKIEKDGLVFSQLKCSIEKEKQTIALFGFADKPDTLSWDFTRVEGVEPRDLRVTWFFSSKDGGDTLTWKSITATDWTDHLRRLGSVSIDWPEYWEEGKAIKFNDMDLKPESVDHSMEEARFWIAMRMTNIRKPRDARLELQHVPFNSVSATNALTLTEGEAPILGTSSGDPFQQFELKHRPLFKAPGKGDPYYHLTVEVETPPDSKTYTEWTRVQDFKQGEGAHYRLDPVTGTIHFGDHDPRLRPDGNGSIPEKGSKIRAKGYRYVVGGAKGNVPPDTVTEPRPSPAKPFTNIASVRNRGPATGGSDEEDIEEAKRRAPEALRNRDRAVTSEDYEYLANEASKLVRKSRCLPPIGDQKGPVWDALTYGEIVRAPGHVNVIIIPGPSTVDPLNDPRPEPSDELLEEVNAYLDKRRMLTAKLAVHGPRYVGINVTARVVLWKPKESSQGFNEEEYKAEWEQKIKERITSFLHPLVGGLSNNGWEVGRHFVVSDLFSAIQLSPDIGFITGISVERGQQNYAGPHPPKTKGGEKKTDQPNLWVELADYEMVCSGEHNVKAEVLKETKRQ